MKIRKVASLCKSNKTATIYNTVDEKSGALVQQYIGTGRAIYPLDGFPTLSENSLLRIFDVSEKQAQEWKIEDRLFPEWLDPRASTGKEKPITPRRISLNYLGLTVIPFNSSAGEILLNMEYLAPVVKDVETAEYYERKTDDGTIYIVVKEGYSIQAFILPDGLPDKLALADLEQISNGLKAAAK